MKESLTLAKALELGCFRTARSSTTFSTGSLLGQLHINASTTPSHPSNSQLSQPKSSSQNSLPSRSSFTMPREADPSINESEFLHKALQQGLRTDGRSPYDMRDVKLTFGEELGWVECRLGETR